jgi:hypothetical protein
MGEQAQGMRDLNAANAETQTPEHSVIGDAIRDRAEVPPFKSNDLISGLHRLLRPSRRPLPTLGTKNQQHGSKELPRRSQTRRCHR